MYALVVPGPWSDTSMSFSLGRSIRRPTVSSCCCWKRKSRSTRRYWSRGSLRKVSRNSSAPPAVKLSRVREMIVGRTREVYKEDEPGFARSQRVSCLRIIIFQDNPCVAGLETRCTGCRQSACVSDPPALVVCGLPYSCEHSAHSQGPNTS